MSLIDARITELKTALALLTTPRPLSEWHEDMGDVLWWSFPIDEPPYCGSPIDCPRVYEIKVNGCKVGEHLVGGWPGYHTHWTPLPQIRAPEQSDAAAPAK